MSSSLRSLRSTVDSRRTPGGRLRAEAQIEVGAAIERARRDGASYSEIAAVLGVSEQTLKRWRSGHEDSSLAVVRVVDPAPAPSAVTVHGPRGVRIEGLSLEQLAALLVRLSS